MKDQWWSDQYRMEPERILASKPRSLW